MPLGVYQGSARRARNVLDWPFDIRVRQQTPRGPAQLARITPTAPA